MDFGPIDVCLEVTYKLIVLVLTTDLFWSLKFVHEMHR